MAIIAVLERKVDGCKQGRHGNVLPGTVRPRGVPRYVEEFRDSGMNLGFAEAVWNWFKTDGVDLKKVLSIEEQRAFERVVEDRCEEVGVEAKDAYND